VQLVPYNLTEDGFETHTAVNYLSQFLLTQLLFKHNLINEPGRILVVSSLANESVTIDFDDLNWKKRAYSLVGAYAQSKLANVLFAKELDERLRRQNRDITAVSIHPGPGNTNPSYQI
jgi:NAD(P)-dependent dehydrogenase (short-subunit alcohol dehydrogenase family)